MDRKPRRLVLSAFLAASAWFVWPGGAVTTQVIRGDRLVSQQSLGEWDGEFCPVPTGASPVAFERQGSTGASAARGRLASSAVVLGQKPFRVVRDRYPSFAAIAVDPMRNEVVVTDENLFQVMFFN